MLYRFTSLGHKSLAELWKLKITQIKVSWLTLIFTFTQVLFWAYWSKTSVDWCVQRPECN
jgi:hypothetical protein